MMADYMIRSAAFVRNIRLPVIALIIVVALLQACQQLVPSDAQTGLPTTNIAVDQPGFLLWSALELEQRNAQLGRTIREDGSSRETLADYLTPTRSHRFRFIRRDRDGLPEQHDNIEDYVYIQSGQGTILVGGQMSGRTGDLGTEIIGGSRYSVGAGDVLRIPAGIPHAYLVGDGGHITYALVRVPAFRGAIAENPDGQAPALDPPGFGLWRAANLEQRNEAIVARMRSDGSSRETLADYGAGGSSHRLRFIRRDRDGWPELHDNIIDVVFVQSGQGTVLVGGEMIGQSNVPGSEINGGSRFPVAAGDVLHIPARTPHAYLTIQGDHITYVLLRVPAFED
mgnify:FL=1